MLRRPIIAYDAGTGRFAQATGAQSITIWDLGAAGQQALATLDTAESTVVALAWAKDQLVTVHETGQIFGWQMAEVVGGGEAKTWRLDLPMVVAEVAHRRDGAAGLTLAIGGISGQLVVVEIGDDGQFKAARCEAAHSDRLESLVFSNDGHRLATSGRDRVIALWSTALAEEANSLGEGAAKVAPEFGVLEPQRRLTGSGGWPLALAFSSTGEQLVSGGMDNGVYLWDLDSSSTLPTVRFEHHGWVETVAWLPDDEAIVSGAWDHSALVFEAPSMDPRFQFLYHTDYVSRVLSVGTESMLWLGSYDGSISVWDGARGSLEKVLTGHRDWVTDLVDLGDGRVASMSSDRTIRLWSQESLTCEAVLGDREAPAWSLGDQSLDWDKEASHRVVVRRFEEDDQWRSTASSSKLSALEDAMAKSSLGPVDLDDVAPAGVGDELSDLVRDAISDGEEVGPDEASEPAALGAGLSGESEDSDPLALFETSQAAGSEVEEPRSEPVFSTPESAPTLTEKSEEETPDDDAGEAVDIMDSLFDPALDPALDPAGESGGDDSLAPASEEPATGDPASQESASEEPDDGDIYDPQPIGPGDEISDVLPNDDELDAMLSGPMAPIEPSQDPGEQGAVAPEEAAPEEVAKSAPAPDENKMPASNKGPFEVLAGSANTGPAEAGADDGGGPSVEASESAWMRGRAPSTLTRAKPLSPMDDVEKGPSKESPTASKQRTAPKTTRQATAPGGPIEPTGDGEIKPPKAVGNQTMTPFTSVAVDEADAVNEIDDEGAGDDAGAPDKPWRPKSMNLSKLKKLARNLNKERRQKEGPAGEERASEREGAADEATKDQATRPKGERKEDGDEKRADSSSKGAGFANTPTQILEPLNLSSRLQSDAEDSSAPSVSEEDDGAVRKPSEKVVDKNYGNQTLMGGMRPYSPDMDAELDGGQAGRESKKQSDTARQLQDFERRRRALSGSKSAIKDGEDSADKAASPGLSEPTISADKGPAPVADAPSEPEAQARAKVAAKAESKLSAESLERDDFWEHLGARAPQMGILKRRRQLSTQYEPSHQIAVSNGRTRGLDLSAPGHRLLTATAAGGIEIWGGNGRHLVTMGSGIDDWVSAGFLEGKRLIYGVSRSGAVHLWALPRGKIRGPVTAKKTVIELGDIPIRCACVDGGERQLLVGLANGVCQLWSLTTGELLTQTEAQQTDLEAVALGQRGPITVGADRAIRFWNLQGLQVDQMGADGAVRDLAAAQGHLAWVEASGAVVAMPEGASRPQKLKGHYGEGRAVIFRDDASLVSGGEDGRLLIHSVGAASGDDPASEVQIPAPVEGMALAGKYLAVSCAGGKVFVFRRTRQDT